MIPVRETQSLNALSPIFVTLEKSGQTVNERQPSNALSLISVKFDVPSTFSKEEHPAKADAPKVSTESGKTTDVTEMSSLKAASPTATTSFPPIYWGITTFPETSFALVIVTPEEDSTLSKK